MKLTKEDVMALDEVALGRLHKEAGLARQWAALALARRLLRRCTRCDAVLSVGSFTVGSSWCKDCKAGHAASRRATWRGSRVVVTPEASEVY